MCDEVKGVARLQTGLLDGVASRFIHLVEAICGLFWVGENTVCRKVVSIKSVDYAFVPSARSGITARCSTDSPQT